ncbi:MAG: AAA family ATPase [Chthonomonadales bacterium]|nr:AAA family ATPase [Chthonomonadales bacterium]
MSSQLRRVSVRNFRALADVSLDLEPVTVLFGPNGSGKSSFLDTIWFARDCAVRGVETASSARSHGIGLLYDGAEPGSNLVISLETDTARYQLELGVSSGRIEISPGELLTVSGTDDPLIKRSVGSDTVDFFSSGLKQPVATLLRDTARLSLDRFLDMEPRAFPDALDMDHALRAVHKYHSRSFNLYRLGQQGSEVGPETRLYERADNLFSVLRNLRDRSGRDDRYETIHRFMRRAFPMYDGLEIEQTSPTTVYCSFLERGRREPIRASGVSDGHLQLLTLLTALFAEPRERLPLIMYDEPETSLHPWALAVFAEAVKEAAGHFGRQVIIATHSPVLISQFEPDEVIAAELKDGRTTLTRVSEMSELTALLDEYAAGSLYMTQTLAPQSSAPQAPVPA